MFDAGMTARATFVLHSHLVRNGALVCAIAKHLWQHAFTQVLRHSNPRTACTNEPMCQKPLDSTRKRSSLAIGIIAKALLSKSNAAPHSLDACSEADGSSTVGCRVHRDRTIYSRSYVSPTRGRHVHGRSHDFGPMAEWSPQSTVRVCSYRHRISCEPASQPGMANGHRDVGNVIEVFPRRSLCRGAGVHSQPSYVTRACTLALVSLLEIATTAV